MKSDAGKALRNSGGRELIQVKTNKGLVPFSVKRRNIRTGKSMKSHQMTNNIELASNSRKR